MTEMKKVMALPYHTHEPKSEGSKKKQSIPHLEDRLDRLPIVFHGLIRCGNGRQGGLLVAACINRITQYSCIQRHMGDSLGCGKQD